ncbi:MAG: hypothetical protein GY855_01690 [candidate division Zixibacteria bacterium]|nr:hypothetical protein [candidate division Zixibacteria bacterium]
MAENQEINRYKFIGFGVYPGKAKEFWENSNEEKSFRERISLAFERDVSYLFNPILTGTERIILIISSIIAIVGFFIPWFSFNYGGTHHSFTSIGFLSALPFLGSLGSWGTGLELPSLIVMSVYILLTPILGIIFLIVLLGKPGSNPNSYYYKVKNIAKLFYIPIILWITLLILASIGFPMPFGNLGVREIGESFNLLSFLSITGIGFYIFFASSLVCSLMASEL